MPGSPSDVEAAWDWPQSADELLANIALQ